MRLRIISTIILSLVFISLNSKTIKNHIVDFKRYDEAKLLSLEEFLHINAELESKHISNIANSSGCYGLYQMNKYALSEIGYPEKKINKIVRSVRYDKDNKHLVFDTTHFNSIKQHEMITEYLFTIEQHFLKHSIKKYVGKKINGIRITKAGILSASFLGYLNVVKFLNSNGRINYRDGNGQSVKYRLKMFENKEIEDEALYCFIF